MACFTYRAGRALKKKTKRQQKKLSSLAKHWQTENGQRTSRQTKTKTLQTWSTGLFAASRARMRKVHLLRYAFGHPAHALLCAGVCFSWVCAGQG